MPLHVYSFDKHISICGKIQASTMVKFLNKWAVMNIKGMHTTIKRIILLNFATKLWTQLCSVMASSRGGGQNLSTDVSKTSLFISFFLWISLLLLFWYAFSPVNSAAFSLIESHSRIFNNVNFWWNNIFFVWITIITFNALLYCSLSSRWLCWRNRKANIIYKDENYQ